MPYVATTGTKKIAKMKARIRAVPGGTSAGKSVSILLLLINMAQMDKKPTLTSIVSESLPHLKKGVIRDFLLIMNEHGYYKDDRWNRTDFTYTFETGSQLEFFSVDQPDKVRGPRRERLWINEANNVPYQSFDQLLVRTKQFVYLDWNPTNEFWYYTNVKLERSDWEELTLTYLDNEALDPALVADIEQHRSDKRWWPVYGEGKLGEVDGKIYSDWAIIDSIPHEAKLIRYGVDFGYTNDPTAIIALYSYNGGFIVDEVSFLKGLGNDLIANILKNKEKALIIGDSSEPKSIAEISQYGLSIVGAKKVKGTGSTSSDTYNKWAIGIVQAQRISITKDSVNVIKEYRNYLWMTDRDGKILNEAESGYDHTMDAIKYAVVSVVENKNSSMPVQNFSKQPMYGRRKYTKFNL